MVPAPAARRGVGRTGSAMTGAAADSNQCSGVGSEPAQGPRVQSDRLSGAGEYDAEDIRRSDVPNR